LPTGNSFYDAIIINHDTAKYLLDFIEPLQLGYGAVIISFLGAIHWVCVFVFAYIFVLLPVSDEITMVGT
jgi:hypothetical protein